MKIQNKELLLQELMKADFRIFLEKVFHEVSPGDEFVDNWHLDAITWHLRQCAEGSVRNLIITQPPRSLKSICASIAFPAWLLGQDPKKRIVCVSYSQELSLELARKFRQVIESDWYARLFPSMRLAKRAEHDIQTTRGGGRLATSVGGTLTGRGGDVLIIDDPIKPEDARSESARRQAIEWYGGTLSSRRNNARTAVTILVMQRLHEEDLAGHLLESATFRHLDLPAIAQEDLQVPTGPSETHAFSQGDLLQPLREDKAVLDEMRRTMGSLVFSAQYLQRPVPAEGNLIKKRWFPEYSAKPEDGQVLQSWDTASSVQNSADYSACVTAVASDGRLCIVDVFRERLAYPDLKREIIDRALRFGAATVLLEDAGSGKHLLAELKRSSDVDLPTFIGRKPEGAKEQRMEAASAMIEAGDVLLPREAPWVSVFLGEILAFPNARHDDQVDALSQMINWYRLRSGFPTIGIGRFGIVPAGEIIRGEARDDWL
ncbi:phage terminase large subunit [Henriciella sp.]|uniref:phage terminase large subunit n=1 Tax=Henriciella sp. TaxID=1968823 RepID=UPI00262FDD92|nr:phage terminase large subunit [Henriciella sp.]